MANGFKVGVFTAAYTGGLPQDQSITDVGFQPKALILFTAGLETADSSPGIDAACGIGFSDGTDSQALGWWSDSGVSPTSCVRQWRQKVIVNSQSASVPQWYEADLKSFDSEGFTITWTTDGGFTVGRQIYYIAFGGNDITNVKLVVPVIQDGTGNKSYTGVGFQPDIIFTLTNSQVVGSRSGGGSGNIATGFGCGMSSAKRWATAHCEQSGATMANTVNAQSYQRTDSILLDLQPTNGSERSRFDLVSLDSDGFTFNQIVNGFTTNTNFCAVLCIKGGNWDLGTTLAPASASDVSVSGLAFAPDGVVFTSDSNVATTAVQSYAQFSIGGGDATTDWVMLSVFADQANPPALRYRDPLSVLLNGGGISKAGLSALGSSGFTLTWDPLITGHGDMQVLWVATKLAAGPAAEFLPRRGSFGQDARLRR